MPALQDRSIYLDNAAAVPCSAQTLEYFSDCALQYPGNQESMGYHGSRSAAALRNAAERLLAILKQPSDSVVFWENTGTGALASAVECACRQIPPGSRIVTTLLEHPALEQALIRSARSHGLKLEFCPADKNGIRMDSLQAMLRAETALLALHHVQSETGGIADLKTVRSLLDHQAGNALLLLDTIQSVGKLEIDPGIRPDLMVLSGQKLGAPGGAAFLCRKKLSKQAGALRSGDHFSGRCTPAAALTLLKCLEEALSHLPENRLHAAELKKIFLQHLSQHKITYKESLPSEMVSPYICHILVPPYQSAILTRALHGSAISIAPGSACESETPGGSKVLTAMGYSKKDSFCGIRVSTWLQNTEEEMVKTASEIAENIKNY